MGFTMLLDMVDMVCLLPLILEQNWDCSYRVKKNEVLIKKYRIKPCFFIERSPGFCRLQPNIIDY